MRTARNARRVNGRAGGKAINAAKRLEVRFTRTRRGIYRWEWYLRNSEEFARLTFRTQGDAAAHFLHCSLANIAREVNEQRVHKMFEIERRQRRIAPL